MENYIINENTVAIIKKQKRTIIYDVENIRVINKNIKTVLNMNCGFYGSSLLGRLKSATKILDKKYKLPIIISENNIILVPIYSLRCENALFIVSSKIIKYEEIEDKLKIICLDNQEFIVDISKYSFEKMLLAAFLLNNTLKWQKSLNFV